MATREITIDICDRCGHEQDRADYMKGSIWGQLFIKYKGDRGGRSWAGDAGGVNTEGKVWLCMTCADSFYEFLKCDKERIAELEAMLIKCAKAFRSYEAHHASKHAAGQPATAFSSNPEQLLEATPAHIKAKENGALAAAIEGLIGEERPAPTLHNP